MAHEFEGIDVPSWDEIKGYFTKVDQQHMLSQTGGALDLYKCDDVLAHAPQIYQKVATGKMPPGNPWPSDKVNGFYSWWKSDPTCP